MFIYNFQKYTTQITYICIKNVYLRNIYFFNSKVQYIHLLYFIFKICLLIYCFNADNYCIIRE